MQYKPDTFFCTKCCRVILSSSPQFKNWMISSDARVVRCPQHITDWAMRCAKIRRTKENYQWRKLAKENDTPPINIIYEPFYDF